MIEREKTLLRLAVSYTTANLDDVVNDTLDYFVGTGEIGKLDFNGEIIDAPTEAEYEELMKILQ